MAFWNGFAPPKNPGRTEKGSAGQKKVPSICAMNNKNDPKFHNSGALEVIHIGSKAFKCIGALPPHDHPHVYINMGQADEILCPFCATRYRYDSRLNPGDADPPYCTYSEAAAVAHR